MSNSIYSFSEIDSTKAFTDLGQSLGGKSVTNIIHIPAENGNGVIRKLDFEPGLHIRVWDFTLTNEFGFHRVPDPATQSQGEQAFTILYILTPDAVIPHSPGLRKDMKFHGPMTTLLISNGIDIHFDVVANRAVKALDITISANWMKNQFSDADPGFLAFIDKMKENPKPSVYVDQGNPVEYRTATDLHEQALEGAKGSLYLKAKTLSLVSEFFSKSFNHNPGEQLEGNVLHQEKMLMVEKILEQHFEKDLPSIEALARKAALSESTLKRHFKMMFGKSIYEYYLEKKMEYAKRLLLEKPLTVKEVAYRLGYEKTSNFIHMFKNSILTRLAILRKISLFKCLALQ